MRNLREAVRKLKCIGVGTVTMIALGYLAGGVDRYFGIGKLPEKQYRYVQEVEKVSGSVEQVRTHLRANDLIKLVDDGDEDTPEHLSLVSKFGEPVFCDNLDKRISYDSVKYRQVEGLVHQNQNPNYRE